MSTAVVAENLGKKYVIRHRARQRYTALRDVLASGLKQIGRFVRSAGDRRISAVKEGHEEFWALRNASFEIRDGERVGIIGRNGAGKSTLLKILSRISEPSEGRAKLAGRVASLLEVGTGFHPELTGRENVFLNGAVLGMKREEILRKFDEIVAFAEVERFLDTQVKHYSSGMYMRLAFSVAAHLDPDILIVDEVLAVGDAQFQKKCIGKMEQVSKRGKTVLFVSHNMGLISSLCSRSMLLENGEIKMLDDTTKVIASYNDMSNMRHCVRIEPEMRNRGDGTLHFEECMLMNEQREPKNSFLIGENLRVEIVFSSSFQGPMSFWLIIFDSTGRPLLSTHQRDREIVRIDHGRYKVSYQTINLGLMPGNYSVSAGAFDTKLKFLEWIDNCQAFEVYPCFLDGTAFDSRWGAANQLAEWGLERL